MVGLMRGPSNVASTSGKHIGSHARSLKSSVV